MPITKFQKRLGIISGWAGTLQSLSIFVTSIMCLSYYYGNSHREYSSNSFNSAVYFRFVDQNFIVSRYLQEVIVTPKAFSACAWIYLLLSFCWFILSLAQAQELKKGTNPKISKTLKAYATGAFLISSLDFLLVVGIGIDISKNCTEDVTKEAEILCHNADIPVLIIMAKGFILWLFNVVSAFILFRVGKMLKKEADHAEAVDRAQMQAELAQVEVTVFNGQIEDRVLSELSLPQYGYEYKYVDRYRSRSRFNVLTGQMEYYMEYAPELELQYTRRY